MPDQEHTHEAAGFVEGPPPSNFFTELAGIPVRFDRLPKQGFPYGAPPGQERKFHCLASFETQLVAAFADLTVRCPWGKPSLILTAGTWVDKPKFHGKGRAFDLDAVFWPTGQAVICKFYAKTSRWYLAIEAVMRRHFGLLLNHFYNADHVDHMHIDDSVPIQFNQDSRSECVFVQAALRDVFGFPAVSITGNYDWPMRDALHKLNAGDLRKQVDYFAFLDRVVSLGFASAS